MIEEELPQTATDRFAEGWIAEALRFPERHDEVFVQRVMTARSGFLAAKEVGDPSAKRGLFRFAAAAALVVACWLFIAILDPDATAVASVREVEGRVEVIRAGDETAQAVATVGTEIFPGDRLVCRSGASVVTDGLGGSWDVAGNLAFGEDSGPILQSGRALCTVMRGPEGDPVAFGTPHCEGETRSAVFEVIVDAASTQVRTLDGSLRVWNSGERRRWTPIEAGYEATATGRAGSSLIAKSFDHQSVKPGDIVWLQEFDTEFREEGSIEGVLTALREGDALVTTIRSIPVTPFHQSHDFKPDEWISLELMSREALFVEPENLEMGLRIRSERPGEIAVAMSPADRKFKTEHVISDKIDIGPDWRRIQIPADGFVPFENSRPVAAGSPVRSIAIWAWGTGTVSVDRIQIRRAKD